MAKPTTKRTLITFFGGALLCALFLAAFGEDDDYQYGYLQQQNPYGQQGFQGGYGGQAGYGGHAGYGGYGQAAGWNTGYMGGGAQTADNFWTSGVGAGNHNADNSAGYVWIPNSSGGTGTTATYGF